MRHTGYVIAILLLLASGAHAAPSAAFAVELEEPRVRLVERADLRIHCRTDKDIDGCAEFLGEILRCRCERRHQDNWGINARAQFIPYLYVTSPQVVAHEQLHLDDISQQLQTFLSDLTSRSFATEPACRADADFESAVFALRMNVFRTDSNERLH